MTTTRPLPPDPRTVADMIPVRRAEIEARTAPVCSRNAAHGPMSAEILGLQDYTRMYCGVWYRCTHGGCEGNAHYASRELAAYHGEPYTVDGEHAETWNGSEWVPISKAEADAYWAARMQPQRARRARRTA